MISRIVDIAVSGLLQKYTLLSSIGIWWYGEAIRRQQAEGSLIDWQFEIGDLSLYQGWRTRDESLNPGCSYIHKLLVHGDGGIRRKATCYCSRSRA